MEEPNNARIPGYGFEADFGAPSIIFGSAYHVLFGAISGSSSSVVEHDLLFIAHLCTPLHHGILSHPRCAAHVEQNNVTLNTLFLMVMKFHFFLHSDSAERVVSVDKSQ